MISASDYINSLDLEFDSEINRSYYEKQIEKVINDAKLDCIDEILSLYTPDGNQEFWLSRIKELRNSIQLT